MTSGPRAIAVGLVLHPTNLVQPLMSGLARPDLEGGSGRSFRSSATPSNRQGRPTAVSCGPWRRKAIALYEQLREAYRERVQGDLSREEPS
jgi:hypothetical protein